jgi:glycosyltransferase involved in cell wall biosynthesis
MIKVAICYRVLQAWRVPVFEKLAARKEFDVRVFYGEDFEGTKVKSYQGNVNFQTTKLPVLKISLSTSNGKGHLPIFRGLYKALKDFSPDVIITEGASNLHGNIVSFLYAKVNGKKIIQWGLGEIEGRKRSLHRRFADIFFRYLESKSDAAIAYSSFGAKYYTKKAKIRPENVFTAVNVVDTDTRRQDLVNYCKAHELEYPAPFPQNFNLLFVGALAKNKNIETLIQAFSNFLRENSIEKAHLTIVGDGPHRGVLQDLCTKLSLNEKVTFTGHISDRPLKSFFSFDKLSLLEKSSGDGVHTKECCRVA